MKTLKLLSLFVILCAFRPHSVAIRVNKHILTEGDHVIVTCIVDRHPENRHLDIMVTNGEMPPLVLQSSSVQLEGSLSPRIFDREFAVTCESKEVVCILEDSEGPTDRAVAQIGVTPCGQ